MVPVAVAVVLTILCCCLLVTTAVLVYKLRPGRRNAKRLSQSTSSTNSPKTSAVRRLCIDRGRVITAPSTPRRSQRRGHRTSSLYSHTASSPVPPTSVQPSTAPPLSFSDEKVPPLPEPTLDLESQIPPESPSRPLQGLPPIREASSAAGRNRFSRQADRSSPASQNGFPLDPLVVSSWREYNGHRPVNDALASPLTPSTRQSMTVRSDSRLTGISTEHVPASVAGGSPARRARSSRPTSKRWSGKHTAAEPPPSIGGRGPALAQRMSEKLQRRQAQPKKISGFDVHLLKSASVSAAPPSAYSPRPTPRASIYSTYSAVVDDYYMHPLPPLPLPPLPPSSSSSASSIRSTSESSAASSSLPPPSPPPSLPPPSPPPKRKSSVVSFKLLTLDLARSSSLGLGLGESLGFGPSLTGSPIKEHGSPRSGSATEHARRKSSAMSSQSLAPATTEPSPQLEVNDSSPAKSLPPEPDPSAMVEEDALRELSLDGEKSVSTLARAVSLSDRRSPKPSVVNKRPDSVPILQAKPSLAPDASNLEVKKRHTLSEHASDNTPSHVASIGNATGAPPPIPRDPPSEDSAGILPVSSGDKLHDQDGIAEQSSSAVAPPDQERSGRTPFPRLPVSRFSPAYQRARPRSKSASRPTSYVSGSESISTRSRSHSRPRSHRVRKRPPPIALKEIDALVTPTVVYESRSAHRSAEVSLVATPKTTRTSDDSDQDYLTSLERPPPIPVRSRRRSSADGSSDRSGSNSSRVHQTDSPTSSAPAPRSKHPSGTPPRGRRPSFKRQTSSEPSPSIPTIPESILKEHAQRDASSKQAKLNGAIEGLDSQSFSNESSDEALPTITSYIEGLAKLTATRPRRGSASRSPRRSPRRSFGASTAPPPPAMPLARETGARRSAQLRRDQHSGSDSLPPILSSLTSTPLTLGPGSSPRGLRRSRFGHSFDRNQPLSLQEGALASLAETEEDGASVKSKRNTMLARANSGAKRSPPPDRELSSKIVVDMKPAEPVAASKATSPSTLPRLAIPTLTVEPSTPPPVELEGTQPPAELRTDRATPPKYESSSDEATASDKQSLPRLADPFDPSLASKRSSRSKSPAPISPTTKISELSARSYGSSASSQPASPSAQAAPSPLSAAPHSPSPHLQATSQPVLPPPWHAAPGDGSRAGGHEGLDDDTDNEAVSPLDDRPMPKKSWILRSGVGAESIAAQAPHGSSSAHVQSSNSYTSSSGSTGTGTDIGSGTGAGAVAGGGERDRRSAGTSFESPRILGAPFESASGSGSGSISSSHAPPSGISGLSSPGPGTDFAAAGADSFGPGYGAEPSVSGYGGYDGAIGVGPISHAPSMLASRSRNSASSMRESEVSPLSAEFSQAVKRSVSKR